MANENNQRGIELAEENKLKDALRHFQAAVRYFTDRCQLINYLYFRFDPQNSEYRNNLGVCWMRLGKLDKAVDEFEQAIAFDESNGNLQCLITYAACSSLHSLTQLLR